MKVLTKQINWKEMGNKNIKFETWYKEYNPDDNCQICFR